MIVICHFNIQLTEAGVMHDAGYVTLSGAPSTTLDYNILSIFHYLGSPLSYRTLVFDLMRNLYIYNTCIYIFSI